MEQAPEDRSDSIVEYSYFYKPSSADKSDWIKCSLKGGHPHCRGYVMRTENGGRYLVGKDCGHNEFGLNFTQVVKQFEYEKDRQYYLLRLDEIIAALPAVVAEIDDIAASHALTSFRKLCTNLSNQFSSVFRDLATTFDRSRGQLYVGELVRDIEAESKRREKIESDFEYARDQLKGGEISSADFRRFKIDFEKKKRTLEKGIYIKANQYVGPLADYEFIYTGPKLKSVLIDYSTRLKTLCSNLQMLETDSRTTQAIRNIIAEIKCNIEELYGKLDLVRQPARFFGTKNMAVLIEWSERQTIREGKFKLCGDLLTWSSPKEEFQTSLTAAETPIAFKAVEKLLAFLNPVQS